MKRGGLLIAGIVGFVLLPATATGKTFKVTRTADTPPNGCGNQGCTLREAVLRANQRPGADVILLKSKKTYELTIPGAGEDLGQAGDLDLTGPTTLRSSNAAKPATVNGTGSDRILDADARLTINGLRLRGGDVAGFGDDLGAAIRSLGGGLTIRRSAVVGNLSERAAVEMEGDGGIRVLRSRFAGNAAQAIRDNGAGGILLSDSRVVGGTDNAVEDFGAGGVRVLRSRVTDVDNHGVQDNDAGGVTVVDSTIARTGSDAVQDFDAGSVTLTRSTVKNTGSQGVQDFDSGSIVLKRSLVTGSELSGVQEFGDGGVRLLKSKLTGNGGGLRVNDGSVRVARSTIARNSVTSDGGGIRASGGTTRLISSTVSGNRSDGDGGGIFVGASARLTVVNSTVAGNSANGSGGGIVAMLLAGEVRLNGVTVARNLADADDNAMGAGGGLTNFGVPARFEVSNTLVALNDQRGGDADDCSGSFGSLGHNLRSDGTDCDGFDGPRDLIRAKPKLGRLRHNGGPAKTVALKQGSPAIGKAGNDAPNRDERGVKRDNNPDIGAFER